MRRCAQTVTPIAAQSAQPSLLSGSGASQDLSSKTVVCAQLIVVNHSPRETAVHDPPTHDDHHGRRRPVNTELTLIALVLGSLAVTALCRRFGLPAPLVLVVAGLAASAIPGVVEVTFDPNVVMLLVLTPLLYSAGLGSSYAGIRANLRPIGLLAVGLVAFTTVVVGLVAWWVVPGLTLPAGLVLGAIVAPPDAVSALSVGRRLGLPRRIMTILNGESLVNDATALTLFRVFIAVAAGTGATVLGGVGMFVLAAVGGTAVGLVVGWVVHRIRRRLDDPQVESALGLVVPFGTYLLAEGLHSSGVLAVVVAGIYLGYKAPEGGYATRLQDQAVWEAIDTILESIVFALIGLQLIPVVREAGAGLDLIGYGLVVTAAAVLARPLWVFPATYVPRALFRGVRKNDPRPPWQVPAVISWTGMRGAVTLAAAFIIPATVPERETLVFLAFFVTVATLLLHGLTLPAVIRLLGVRETGTTTDVLAEAQAQQAAAQAGIARLEELTADEPDDSPAGHAAMKLRRAMQMRANSAWEQLGRPESETGEAPSTVYRRLRRETLITAREEFVARRDAGEIDDDVLRRMIHELDLEEATLDRDRA
jgi:monovalent cation/hydrogen antiporter